MVSNLYQKIYILFEHLSQGDTYAIYKLNHGCPEQNPMISGIVSETLDAVHVLPDGEYILKSIADTEDTIESFNVYYNGLSTLIPKIQKVLCPCDSCDTYSEDEVFALVFYILGYAESVGLCHFTHQFFNEFRKVTDQEDEMKKYYNRKSISYTKHYLDFIAYFYIYLYKITVDNVKTSDADLSDVNGVFQIDEMEQCLFHLGYSFENILCRIKKKCDCDE